MLAGRRDRCAGCRRMHAVCRCNVASTMCLHGAGSFGRHILIAGRRLLILSEGILVHSFRNEGGAEQLGNCIIGSGAGTEGLGLHLGGCKGVRDLAGVSTLHAVLLLCRWLSMAQLLRAV